MTINLTGNALKHAYNQYLLESILECNLDNVTEALRLGADINWCDEEGTSMLMFAAQLTDKEIYNYLLVEGADRTLVDEFGMTARDYIRSNQPYNYYEYLDNGSGRLEDEFI